MNLGINQYKRFLYWLGSFTKVCTIAVLLLGSILIQKTEAYPLKRITTTNFKEDNLKSNLRDSLQLKQGNAVEKKIAPTQLHSYRINVESGQYLRILLRRRSTNVQLSLFDSNDKKLREVKTFNIFNDNLFIYNRIQEEIAFVSEAAGTYRLEIQTKTDEEPIGHYKLTIEQLRNASPADKISVTAKSLEAEAEKLEEYEQKQSKYQEVIKLYQEALQLYQSEGNKQGEADTLTHLGNIYEGYFSNDLSDISSGRRKRLEYYRQALLIWRDLKKLTQIADIYQKIGGINARSNPQEAISFYNRALEIYRQTGDRYQEVYILLSIADVITDRWSVNATSADDDTIIDYLKPALQASQKLSARFWEANILTRIAQFYSRKDWQATAKYYEQASTAYQAVRLFHEQAESLRKVGDIYKNIESYQKAIEYYKKALLAYPQENNSAGKSMSLKAIGNSYIQLGEYQKAIESFNQATEVARKISPGFDREYLKSLAETYSLLGDHQQALKYYKEMLLSDRGTRSAMLSFMSKMATAVAVTIEPLTKEDIHTKINTLLTQGFYANLQGETEKAANYLNQSLSEAKSIKDSSAEANALLVLSAVYYSSNEPSKAVEYFNQAFPLLKASEYQPKNSIPSVISSFGGDIGDFFGSVGLIYFKAGEPEQALTYLYQALLTATRKGGQADWLHDIGIVMYRGMNEPQAALRYLDKSRSLYQSIKNQVKEAATLKLAGEIYFAQGEKQKAITSYEQALSIYQNVNNRSEQANILYSLAVIQLSQQEQQKALDNLNQALKLAQITGDRSGEANTIYQIAITQRQQGNLTEALTQIEAAIKIAESLRTKISSQKLRASYFATVQSYYELYINLLMQLHQKKPSQGYDAQAFYASERSRARSLLELLTEAKANIRSGVDSKLVEAERNLQFKLDALEKRRVELYSANYTEEQVSKIAQEQEQVLFQYQEIQAQIRATSPRYASLSQPQPLNLREIQQQVLDENTLLLQYSLGEERSYLWAVTKTSITSYELPKSAEIEELAKRFQQEELVPPHRRIRKPENAKASTALSRILLQPVAKLLENKRLVIVADGALQYIPFAALPSPSLSVESEVLIVNHEIVSLPSASTLAVLRRDTTNRKTPGKTVALIADPVFSTDDDRLGTIAKSNKPSNSDIQALALSRAASQSDVNLTRIPYTRDEADAIMALLSTQEARKVLDFAASRSAAFSPELAQYKIVHFATHGILNSQNPELSGIVLSLFDDKGNPQNGFLRLHDIYNLNLPVELVVLSACQTGLGKEIKGEGLVGLTRGFMYAGAPRVVVSLWNVNDAGTAELMKRFYQKMLSEKLKPAAALRAAQIEMLQTNWKAPYYWAAFMLQGEWN